MISFLLTTDDRTVRVLAIPGLSCTDAVLFDGGVLVIPDEGTPEENEVSARRTLALCESSSRPA